MKADHFHWNVSVWVQGSSRPVQSTDFRDNAPAERHANILREQVKRIGSTHVVRVTPVFVQALT